MDSKLKMPWYVLAAYVFLITVVLAVVVAFHWWIIVSCWPLLVAIYLIVLFLVSLDVISKWERRALDEQKRQLR